MEIDFIFTRLYFSLSHFVIKCYNEPNMKSQTLLTPNTIFPCSSTVFILYSMSHSPSTIEEECIYARLSRQNLLNSLFSFEIGALLKELRNCISTIFECGHYFVPYGFIQVCIFCRFFSGTTLLSFCASCVLSNST